MRKNCWILLIIGAVVGLVNGFMGGGGGVFVVVALTFFLKLQQKSAHATALLIILPVSIISAVIYVANGNVDWLNTLYATIGVVAGGTLGAFLLKKIDDKWLKLIFSFILILAGVRMFLAAT